MPKRVSKSGSDPFDGGMIEKAIRLIEYLTQLASLRSKVIREVDSYEQVLWIHNIPKEKGCFTRAWGREEAHDADAWIEVDKPLEPELPRVPDTCTDWVDMGSIRNTANPPNLQKTITRSVENPLFKEGTDQPRLNIQTEKLDDHPSVFKDWEIYLKYKWMPWVEQYGKWKRVHKVYGDLWAIHQAQQGLGEEYELVFGIGLLSWQTPSDQRVRRHLVVANALLEFDKEKVKFVVRPNTDGAIVRPEMDMLDINERPKDAARVAEAALENAGDDPWNNGCVEGVLKGLVNSISPNGKYEPGLKSSNSVSQNPLVEYAPALILRKRSTRGLTDLLRRIKERIAEGGEIPSEFADLAEIRQEEDRETSGDTNNPVVRFNGEIYFPKASNEEQRKIIEKLQTANGVLVQGPPGTGKSHTIANLICHLLATGQRILITAKTPRALQVLEGLLPPELRPLCINLLGTGPEEKRSLEASVNGVLTKQWDEKDAQSEITRLESSLYEKRKEKAGIENRLRAIRESETKPQTIADGSYRGRAAQIVRAVMQDADKYNWFTDQVLFDQGYPLAEVDFGQLLRLLRGLIPDTIRQIRMSWPGAVPSVERFSELVSKERIAVGRRNGTSANLDAHFLSQTSIFSESLTSIRNSLERLINETSRIKSMPHGWVTAAVYDVLSSNELVLQELHKVSEHIICGIADLVGKVDSNTITFPNAHEPQKVLEDAKAFKDHLGSGGGLGWGPFRPKAVKSLQYIIHEIKVNGRPCNDLKSVTELIDTLHVRIELERGWRFWIGRAECPQAPYSLQFQAFKSNAVALAQIIALTKQVNDCREVFAKRQNLREPVWHDEKQLQALVNTCIHALADKEARQATAEIEYLEASVSLSTTAGGNAHPVTARLLQAIRERSRDGYAQANSAIEKLNNVKQAAHSLETTINSLKLFVPQLTDNLCKSAPDSSWEGRLRNLPTAWNWARASNWVNDYIKKGDTPSLAHQQKHLEDEIGEIIAKIASLRAWSFCFSRMSQVRRRHMEAWRQAMRKLGRGTGISAPRHRRDAQEHLNESIEAVPAWVMPLHRVWDTVKPAPGMFDVIVVDEASQCGFEALPLLYLGKKILIVGDDKQISPVAVGITDSVVANLMSEYLKDFKHKSSFDIKSSLFDQGKLRYSKSSVTLLEHFRCMPEIIRFSNDLCYSTTPLLPLRQYQPERLTPLEHVYIKEGFREGSDNRVINRPEANAIVDKIVELCQDQRYMEKKEDGTLRKKTMGVIVLQGEAQADIVRSQLLERLGAKEMEERRLICGDPYSFQGDERDIIFLSMVAAPNERFATLTKDDYERRFNVAASRAKDQMWLFHSVTREDLSPLCLRRRLLEFFENTQPPEIGGVNVDQLRQISRQANRTTEKQPKPFDSWFEVDVALEIASKNYRAIPQYEVAGKFIDLVVEGGHARLAVECDGDRWHGPDQYEQDMQRQRMLERCKWVFFRVRELEFYSDKTRALAKLWGLLKERGIVPQC